MANVYRVFLKNNDPSLAPATVDVTLPEGGEFEYRENSFGSWPAGYFFYKEGDNSLKSDYACFFPSSSVVAIIDRNLL